MKTMNAASAYKEALFENAPPLKIVHMLYEGALRFLAQAELVDPKKDPARFSEKLRRADRIVSELRLSLDHAQAPDLCGELTRLYLFVERQVQESLLTQRTEPLEGAKRVLETLLEAWRSIEFNETPAAQ